MPIYEYECESCHKEIEIIRKSSETHQVACPHCHELKLKKKLSLNSFLLKGGGWYKDGYGSTKASQETSTEIKTSDNNSNKAVA